LLADIDSMQISPSVVYGETEGTLGMSQTQLQV